MGVKSLQPYMPTRSKIAGLLCGMLLSSVVCFAAPAKKASRKPAAQKKVEQPAPVPAPVVPPPPATLAEQPAVPPNVAMNNGLLTITAENSTLSDVLSGVKRATGAAIDVPSTAAGERVVVHLGPGQPPDVLRQLLTGSKFDYIIVGSPQNAAAVQRVILTARGAAGTATPSVQQAFQPPQPSGYQPPEEPVEDDSNNQPEPEPTPEVTQPPLPQVQPGQVQPQQQQQGPKTPEQLLQELQQMQRQQRPERNPQPQ